MNRYFTSGSVLCFALFGGMSFFMNPGILELGALLGWLIICAGFVVIVTHREVTSFFIPALWIIGAMLLSSLVNFSIADFALSRVWLYTVALCAIIIGHAYLNPNDVFDGLYFAGLVWPGLWLMLTLSGWLDNSNIAAFWPLLFVVIGLYRPGNTAINLLYLVTQLLMLSWFSSRGAWLGLAVIFLIVLWPYLRGAWPLYAAGAIVGLGLLIVHRPDTASYRLTYWFEALAAFVDAPLFGIGPGGLNAQHIINEFGGGYQLHAHNILISWLAQTGLVGLACLMLAIKKIYSMQWLIMPWQRALLAGLLAWSMVDEPLFWPGPLIAIAFIIGTIKGQTTHEHCDFADAPNSRQTIGQYPEKISL